ncbi:hypothetical protein AZE42_05595 [Rhizopogon vesiculosus]|uniref:Uncharacterized protein n=1 Tax=Rhizopogon vesiculosus TaxID=180088 RepID=A0A1J8PY13_9AGAM|nr:hypothetical protein AZE42_05595 [Rhizopogon vesiculosus]
MVLTIPKAELTGVFLESLAYGFCYSHLIIDIVRNMDAFTSNEGVPNYPSTYYGTWDTWKNIVKSGLYVAVTLVSDAFILYRSFILWGRNYLIITFPFLLFIADIAIGVFWTYTLSLVLPGENVFADALSIRVTTFYSITLAMNVICTTLIAVKILRTQRAVSSFSSGNEAQVSRLVPIIIESDVIDHCEVSWQVYSVQFLRHLSCPSFLQFSSVIVRVGLGLSHGDSHHTPVVISSARNTWAIRASSRNLTNSQQVYTPSFPDGGAQVSLQQTIHTHIDAFPDDIESRCSRPSDYKRSPADYRHTPADAI